MKNAINGPVRDASLLAMSALAWNLGDLSANANPPSLPANALPAGGIAVQGSANISAIGSQLNVTTSGNAQINWSSFNVGSAAQVNFNEPSSTSVVWNHINDSNPSQILGAINANGFVVLQNQNGFVVGGNAAIKATGLLMTTSPTPPPNLSSGGAWQFDSPPPSIPIINYGQITVAGGPVYLIANDIENYGTISARQGQIGLYDGKEVLVSTSPTGAGLCAKVTLPAGSVDNEGRLIADGGKIAAMAQTINQNGLVQANSVQDVNGVIELVASGDLNLGTVANPSNNSSSNPNPASDIEANGDTSATTSPGGFVVLAAGNSFSDNASSQISVSGQNAGKNGIVEVLADNLSGVPSLNSRIGNNLALLVNPYDLTLSYRPTGTSLDANQNVEANFSLNDLAAYAQIDLFALNNIELTTAWTLNDPSLNNPGAWGSLSLAAGNSIVLAANTSLTAGNNWTVNLTAGTAFAPTTAQPAPPAPPAGGGDGLALDHTLDSSRYSYGVYLDDGATLQTQNGDINIWAANEVIVHTVDLSSGALGGSISTLGGGNISVTAQYGNVNAGNDIYGYDFDLNVAPYYEVDPYLGGISTGAGGNVTIKAGGDVISYLPTQSDYNNYGSMSDAGTGAFGPEPGNVSITAGGSVYGNYVVANGVGTIVAGANAGLPVSLSSPNADFALSLVKGGWNVCAQNIYLDDVLNPNGVFNDNTTGGGQAGAHYFDYDAKSSVLLNAANAVEITGAEVPLQPASNPTVYQLPVLLPPSLSVIAGAGGFTLDTDVILFPSAQGNLSITTTDGGNFASRENPNDPSDINIYSLEMSQSGQKQFTLSGYGTLGNETFGYADRAAAPLELNNPGLVQVNISGSMNDISLYTALRTDLTVDGNMFNSSLVGQNLHPSDITAVNVTGGISYSPVYAFVTLTQPLASGWQNIFSELVDPNLIKEESAALTDDEIAGASIATIKKLAASCLAFPSGNPGFVYNASTSQVGYVFRMSSATYAALAGNLEMIALDAGGNPVVQKNSDGTYSFATVSVSSPLSLVAGSLYNASQASTQDSQHLSTGFQMGGPGQLNVTAASIDLGASGGIVSWGSAGSMLTGGVNYGSLASLTGNAGASVDINVTGGNLDMLTSTIASIDGGNVTVKSSGEVNLGLANLALTPVVGGNLAYGIYTAGTGDVTVEAKDDINVDTARIATFNGGNVSVISDAGDVNAGDGANLALLVPYYWYDSSTGVGVQETIQNPRPYGSGIMALAPTKTYQVSATATAEELPGNITVETPNGNIVSTLGGISQFALDGDVAGGPTINLTAGTPGVAASSSQGNIELGQGGVVGGTVNLSAQGNVSGLIVSRQDTTVKAVRDVDITVLSTGTAAVSAGGLVTGTLVAVAGVSASGQSITANMISGNVSTDGGAGKNTLGTATTSAASDSAANQSNTQAKDAVAGNSTLPQDDQKKNHPTLTQRVKRVTVILPKS